MTPVEAGTGGSVVGASGILGTLYLLSTKMDSLVATTRTVKYSRYRYKTVVSPALSMASSAFSAKTRWLASR